jgi:Putative beta-barrel porin 2
MRRSGALTLGVVLTLGAVTGGRAQDLSGSVTSASGSSFGGFALPSVPDNWADLPVKLTASQTVSYNSNLSGFPVASAVPPGQILGDFNSTTNFGFSTRANLSSQQLYFDGSFGVIRYLRDVSFDSTIYSINTGVDWTVTSRCSGTLGVSVSKSPAEITEQVGTGVNYSTTTAINETGKCAVANGYSFVFNSGLTTTKNSDVTNALNNGRTALLSAGIEYAKGASTLTALASLSDQTFTNRGPAAAAAGLSSDTDFHSFTLNYTRQINSNLSVTGVIGLVGVTSGFSLGLPKSLLPIYTVSTNWALTPKLALIASASKTIAPPTTLIANAEQSYNASVGLTYQLTPKVVLNAAGSIGYSASSSTTTAAEGVISPFFFDTQNTYTLNAGLTYSMTPFLSAALNASYNERVADHLITPQDVVTLSLNYKPY